MQGQGQGRETFKAKDKDKDKDWASLEFEDWTKDYGTRHTYMQTIVCK